LVLAGAAAIAGLLWYGLYESPHPSLPPLLRGSRVSTHRVEICGKQRGGPFSEILLSPQLEERLSAQFPEGTEEGALTAALASHGFQPPTGACPEDSTIRVSLFSQTGGGLLRISTAAHVFWKVDAVGRIVWTHGTVYHEGL
jgi:hypothetical protein